LQMLRNNLVGRAINHIKFVGDHSNCRRLCFVSQRRRVQIAVHIPPFLAHPERLCATEIQNLYQVLSEYFVGMNRVLPSLTQNFIA
jgi:hypothetical protein